MLDRFWVGGDGARPGDGLQPSLGVVEVRTIVADAEARPRAVAEHQVHRLGVSPLKAGQELRIQTGLQQSGGLRAPSQFGVDDLVGMVAQPAGPIRLLQEVGISKPTAVEQGGLIDDVRACSHRLERSPMGFKVGVAGCGGGGHGHDRLTLVAVAGKLTLLVLGAEACDQLELRIAALRPLDFAPSSRHLLLRQMRAFEEAGEVARAENDVNVNQMHLAPPSRVELNY